MKVIQTNNPKEATYSYETYTKIKDFEIEDYNETVFAMTGRDWKKCSKRAYDVNLSDDVLYVARRTLKTTGPEDLDHLLFFHVSMKKKTLDNLERGWKKFHWLSE